MKRSIPWLPVLARDSTKPVTENIFWTGGSRQQGTFMQKQNLTAWDKQAEQVDQKDNQDLPFPRGRRGVTTLQE